MRNILKKIYWKLPFKKKLFSLLKNIYVPSSDIYKHLRFSEPFKAHIGKDYSFQITTFQTFGKITVFSNVIMSPISTYKL